MGAYVDKFVSVSLRDPVTKDIVSKVNVHHHTHTCRKKDSNCRFQFPRLPSRKTILARPLRLVFLDENEKLEKHKQIRTVLTKVSNVLIEPDSMARIDSVGREQLDEAFELEKMILRLDRMIEKPHLSKQILKKKNKQAEIPNLLVNNI